jgi:cyclopropane fatty-acyl-phospholipid synthase-like methyltransferase
VQTDDALPCAPAAERNFRPILGVLRREFREASRVLEIGAGTGQHAAGFAREMPWLHWHATDCRERLNAIGRWRAAATVSNLAQPVALEVGVDAPPRTDFDAAFSANTAHILGEGRVFSMFETVAAALSARARFCLYGPFRESGRFDTESNERFDASLRSGDPDMGIRDIEKLDEFAAHWGLGRIRRFAMPGNNQILVYERNA